LGLNSEAQDLNDGTLIRALSPRPGPISAQQGSSVNLRAKTSVTSAATSRKPAAKVQLQALRQGRRGPDVKNLQRLLNVRLTPSPQLAVDGIFGPITHQGVLQYQRGLAIRVDGVVGEKTWYHLLKGDKAKVFPPPRQLTQHPSSPELQSLAQPPNWTPLPTQKVGVWEWSMQHKFEEVLRRTAPKVPSSMRNEFEALLSPTSLGVMAGTLVLWAGSHAFGVGEIVDVILLVGGLVFLGLAVFDVARELGDFLVVTSTAADEKDLDEAASHLAKAIAIMGVAAFIALLAKVAKGKGGGKGTGAEVPPKTPPKRSAPQSREAATAEAPPPKAPVPSKSPIELQLDEMYAKAPGAKAEIDTLAESIAKETGGKVAKAPLKGRARSLEKAIEYEKRGGDASNVKDIARNTIVVEQSQYDKAVALLKEQGAKVKSIDPASDPMGYSGTNAVVKTKAGIPAEIQVNTPEMIYAKEKPEIARAILGDEKYAELVDKSGVPGGRGHQLYEEYRSLPEGDERAAKLAAESRAYYDQVRTAGGQ
jgi:hypothetical protein